MANENGKSGGPGRPGSGFEFGSPGGRGGFGGRDGDRGGGGRGRGDRDGRRGGGKDRESSGGAYKVVTELSALEKSLSKGDFGTQRGNLEQILKSLRPLRLKSLESLDFTARGRLLTTLLRVARQPKPSDETSATGEAAEAETAPSSEEVAATETASAEEAAPEAASVEAAPEGEGAEAATEPAPTDEAAVAAAPESQPAPKAEKAPESKGKQYTDVMTLIARIWRAVNDHERAAKAFDAAGVSPDSISEEALPEREAKADKPRAEGPERGPRGERSERGPRAERGERKDRPPRPDRPPRAESSAAPRQKFADWREEAKHLETIGRTRDAARLLERNKEFTDAVRLFEAGGDLKSALRCALGEKDQPQARRLAKLLQPAEAGPILEKGQAFELLMEHYIEHADFGSVAGLYERARQFDQAALAWERAGKFSMARKAFERAKDPTNAERVRKLEIDKLVEKGDRLGAATVLLGSNQKEKAVEVLKGLPSSKAFRFLQQLKLNDEANALAQAELAQADSENKPGTKARWLETLGDFTGAAQSWEKAERKDKAIPLWEKAENWAHAAELAEGLKQREKAIELYKKAGDTAGAERAAALPVETAAPAPVEKDEAEEEAQHPPPSEEPKSNGDGART